MAESINLTATYISKLKANKKCMYEIKDAGAKGLRLRVNPSGWKSFIWRYMTSGKSKVYTIGRFIEKYKGDKNQGTGFMTLADARNKLGDLKALHKSGKLITAKEQQQKDKERIAEEHKLKVKVETVIEDFYKTLVTNRRRPETARQLIDAEILGKRKGFTGKVLGGLVLREITTADVRELIQNTVDRGVSAHAMRLLALLKQFFGWCENGGLIDRSPIDKLSGKFFAVKPVRAEHLLDIDLKTGEPVPGLPEIVEFFKVLDKSSVSLQVKNGLKILLLTGVRSGELRKAQIGAIVINNWHIPAEDTKTLQAWTVPLSPFVLQLFEELEDEVDEECGFYLNCIDKNNIARRLNHIRKKQNWPTFTPHTLRKVFRTHLELMGVSGRVAEKCLNHSLGSIDSIYNKGSMLEQRRSALIKWSDKVEKALKPEQGSNIVKLRA